MNMNPRNWLNLHKLGVVVKLMEKPRLVLKFIWMEKNIGLALDQLIPGYETIPISPYYFWPRKGAWEELKIMLESKPWISHKQVIILLNQVTDIINLWQQTGGDIQEAKIGEDFALFIGARPPVVVNEFTRFMGAEVCNPYDIAGVNRHTAADNRQKCKVTIAY
ncbi:hypothetical protein LXL04_000687 [Taraxacum kok-saghyz]